MARILIAYFSRSGSTDRLSEQLKKTLEQENHSVSFFSIGRGSFPSPDQYDVLGIGSPVYFYRLPFNVSDFLKDLPDLQGKSAFFFYTFGTLPGKAPKELYNAIKKSGARYLGHTSSYGKDFWLGYIKRGVLFCPESPTEDELATIEAFAQVVHRKMAEGTEAPEDSFPATGIIFALERLLLSRSLVKLLYSRLFFVSKRRCSSCATCVQGCPMGNIIMKKKIPNWGRNCLLCMSCELFCPEGAITSAVDWPIFAPFMHYNISRGKAMGISCCKVTFKNGKMRNTEKIL